MHPRRRNPLPLLITLLLTGLLLAACALALAPGQPASTPVPEATPSSTPAASSVPTPQAVPDPTPRPTAAPTPQPTPAATPEPYDYAAPVPQGEAVELDWFDQTAFIGDSRTEGLLLYTDLGKHATPLAYRGLNVQSARTESVIGSGEQKTTVLEALGEDTYDRVYLSLGVNELGWYNDQRYYDNYSQLIDLVRECQPDAQIYLQTLIPVTAEKSAQSYINNPQILVYNELIAQLAEEKEVYLVDTWSAFAGEEGALDPSGSTDGVHLTRAYYKQWLEYLRTHTVAP